MLRGTLGSLNSHDIYARAPKSWYVSPVQCDCFWFDLIDGTCDIYNDIKPIHSYLQLLKTRVEQSLEKRFIYMFGARKKIRFDVRKPLSLSIFSRKLHVNVFVGRESRRLRLRCDLSKLGIAERSKLTVLADERFLTLTADETQWFTISVHDFMQELAEDFGESTEIHYVGLTKNPHDRPLGRDHRGYADMVKGVGSEDHDFFLYVSLFKAFARAKNEPAGFHFLVANSMIDEVNVQSEGELIEKAFIAYFDSKYQDEKGARERARLEALLQRLNKEKCLQAVVVDMEFNDPSPYYRFSSRIRMPAYRHAFRCSLREGKLSIEALPEDFNAMAELS